VLNAFDSHASQTAARRLIGSNVVFVGGEAPPGGTANLILQNGILLKVTLTHKRNILPQAAAWAAEVRGTLTGIDFKGRSISIKCNPKDWRVTSSM
jgi:hypothetical protein